ncbi:hypothetical protein [Streptomyces flaveolus]|uniref:hypothetical protein n=1 Tax=Streptomyces flaveolus TaxID=67297 RepID=UPI0037033C15
MSATSKSFGPEADGRIESERFGPPGGEVTGRPAVPHFAIQGASSGRRATAWDRLLMWQTYGEQFRRAVEPIEERLLQADRQGRDLPYQKLSTLTDLAAVHLYLTQEWPHLGEAVPDEDTSVHRSLARCVASGLLRLPTYRGPAGVRTPELDGVTDRYRKDPLVVDMGFWAASKAADALRGDGSRVIVWSLTGRLTSFVDPFSSQRLVFLPGTRFKVLKVTEGPGAVVLMRELFPSEPVAHDTAGPARDNITWLDESTVADLESSMRSEGPVDRVPGLDLAAHADITSGA